ncbi:WS/DGAT/MGAT family O-acyltransferase [Massilia glaciei]|nr:wax ester/triacylglycerol synthase family O-acyltransferase [Massilia glaciei]
MEHLSGLDATFLHLETPEMPMHVGALHQLDLPEALEGDYIDAVKRHVADRMHLATVFTKKLALMPFDIANPVWVDDDDVDLDYHIRQITLPRPGTQAQLEAYVGRLHSSLLDRSRPLWEFYVFDGLASGQIGFYTKIHHAALDGQGAIVLANALLDLTPVPREVAPPRQHAQHDRAPYQPPVVDMLKAALRDTLIQCTRLVRGVPTGLKAVAGVVTQNNGEGGKRRLGLPSLSFAPKTPLNASITNQRVFATAKFSLKEALAVGKTFGGTLNDAVMAIVSGALRRYLEQHHALPERSLVAAVPVSLRAEGNTDMNNQVSMMLMQLASDEADPRQRMRAIVKASAKMKKTVSNVKSIMPTDFPSLGVPWLMSGLVALYGRSRLADRLPPIANVVVSNVPGPRMPLYLAGARMTTNFPVSIVTHGLALNVTVQSYNGALDFGMIACRRAMPDVQQFAACMVAAHEELLEAALEIQAAHEREQTGVSEAEVVPAKKRAAPRKAANKAVVPKAGAKPAPKRKPRAATAA